MKTSNAIKKLEKAGYAVKNSGSQYSASKTNSNYRVEFIDQKGSAICIGFRHLNDNHDWQSDYCATIFCDNIAQAIRCAA